MSPPETQGNQPDSNPLVTAILPTYNRRERLRQAVESIMNQTYRPLELLVVDDASSEDYAQEIVAEIAEDEINTHTIRHDENQGASAARNTGIHAANGEYVAFLDDDDEWLPRKIEQQINELKRSGAGVAFCWVRRVGPDGKHRASHTPTAEGDITRRLLLGNVTGTTSSIVAKTELCRSIGGFATSFPRWNDWDFALRASQQTDFVVVSEILVRQHSWDGPQLSDDFDKLQTAKQRLLRKHGSLAAEYGMAREMNAWVNFGVGYSAGMAGKYGLARRHLFRAIRQYPYESRFYIHLLAFSGGKFTLRPAQILRRAIHRRRSRNQRSIQ